MEQKGNKTEAGSVKPNKDSYNGSISRRIFHESQFSAASREHSLDPSSRSKYPRAVNVCQLKTEADRPDLIAVAVWASGRLPLVEPAVCEKPNAVTVQWPNISDLEKLERPAGLSGQTRLKSLAVKHT